MDCVRVGGAFVGAVSIFVPPPLCPWCCVHFLSLFHYAFGVVMSAIMPSMLWCRALGDAMIGC